MIHVSTRYIYCGQMKKCATTYYGIKLGKGSRCAFTLHLVKFLKQTEGHMERSCNVKLYRWSHSREENMDDYTNYSDSVTVWILKDIISLQHNKMISNRNRYTTLYNFHGTYHSNYRIKAPARKIVYWLGMSLHTAELKCSYSISGTGAKFECIFQNMHKDWFSWHKEVISGWIRTDYSTLKQQGQVRVK